MQFCATGRCLLRSGLRLVKLLSIRILLPTSNGNFNPSIWAGMESRSQRQQALPEALSTQSSCILKQHHMAHWCCSWSKCSSLTSSDAINALCLFICCSYTLMMSPWIMFPLGNWSLPLLSQWCQCISINCWRQVLSCEMDQINLAYTEAFGQEMHYR